MAAVDFSSLLLQSSKLPTSTQSTAAPTATAAHLLQPLTQLSSTVHKLTNTITSTQLAPASSTAIQSYALQHSLKLDENAALLRKLDTAIQTQPAASVSVAQQAVDIDTYLSTAHSELLNTLYFNQHKAVQQQIQQLHTATHQQQHWTALKHSIMQAHTATAVRSDTMDTAEQTYATVVVEYNKKRNTMQLFNVSAQLCHATELILKYYAKLNDAAHVAQFNELYDLFYMCSTVLNEQRNIDLYTNIFLNTYGDTVQAQLQQRMLQGSIQYTQQLYEKYVHALIQAQPALVAGTRSVAYVKVHKLDSSVLQSKLHITDKLNGVPIWPQIYYNLRVGAVSDNVLLLDDCIKYGYTECRDIKHVVQHTTVKSEPHVIDALLQQYHTFDDTTDVYKRLVYSILLQRSISVNEPVFELIKQYVLNTIEDVLFYYLSCVPHTDVADSLQHVQALFADNTALQGNTLSYFKVLFLTQQYNAAVAFLSKHTPYALFSLHITPVLYFYNLYTDAPLLQSMLQANVLHYSINYPTQVFHYIYTLHRTHHEHWSHDDTSDASVELQVQLLCKCKYYELLVGSATDTAVLQNGLLYEFYAHDTAAYIVTAAAGQLYEQGSVLDAIMLYTLAQAYHDAAELLLQHIALFAPQPHTAQRNDIIQLTTHFLLLCPSNDSTAQQINDLNTMLKVCNFYDLIQLTQLNDAIDTILQLRIAPLQHTDVSPYIQQFKQVTTTIQTVLVQVFIQLTQLYATLVQQQRQSIQAVTYKKRVRTLITFIGLLGTSLSNEQNQQLIQCEIAIS